MVISQLQPPVLPWGKAIILHGEGGGGSSRTPPQGRICPPAAPRNKTSWKGESRTGKSRGDFSVGLWDLAQIP